MLNRSSWNQRTPACGVNAQRPKQESPAVAKEDVLGLHLAYKGFPKRQKW